MQDVVDTGLSVVDTITNVALEMSNTLNNAVSLLKTPQVFIARISALYNVIGSFSTPLDALKNIKNTSNLNTAEEIVRIDTNTEKGKREAESKQQIELLCQRAGICSQANIIASMVFNSSKEADDVLNDFISQVEEQIITEVPTDEETLQALKDLRSVLVQDIANTIKKLPDTKIIQIPQSIPSVVLAYELYEDIDRADEIIKRNNISNPCFIPARTDLEVLQA
jgi:prophage DNA circulation protein